MHTNGKDPIGMIVFAQKIDGTQGTSERTGLSKREYFAAMAMQGLAGDTGIPYYGDPMFIKSTAEQAVDLVDALIKALNEEKPNE